MEKFLLDIKEIRYKNKTFIVDDELIKKILLIIDSENTKQSLPGKETLICKEV
ncbi:hypothetical protein [Clostridium sp. D53t1_180928_C8]|uniref:hypothetical protein n=1 Tax=Clostridium sp. D53t1_180928_C8 TaxID=2787101 RepID=UPI0018A9A901|nr:hypothetical protein [Clostridium sp. D53t1_180928_C8]